MNTSTRVEFGLYDVTARSDSAPVTEDAKDFCNLSKDLLLESVPNQNKYGTLETRQWLMDGRRKEFHLMWQTPVYDRTAADVAAGAEKCYITAELLNRIEGNTAHMAQLLGVEIDTRTWTSLGLLTRAQMQRILGNLATVRAAYYTLPGTPNIPTAPSTLYSAINDMEQVLWSLHELWQRNSVKQYAGEICAGQEIGVI